ncbi:hypothetical protein IG612_10070 [Pectobacterium sp. FL60-S17]|uniref:Uncharacterized protein n=1 Tax=Pectobacterium quasiaquaticum TaxID=2774015 RepID=A0A9Q2ICQ6_9GAMM|nr:MULTISPECIES: hypothetical protein [Pectobacterium]MBE5202947.1 hypothetical protein [Pectobacterium quasiaquaticum]MBE5209484.1 hypothetical protein [Pectobacterium quasiaquaticum]MBE5212717.1 hypothetical protein [Pectobacterium quasiaquaticum]MBE5226046.1 hypothetical protein [Pectobacterium quasiaquaticum]MBN3064902.1 hypothetical protein [Pectobacterium aquaticum]
MMDKRALILKSGLTVRELLRLKNNYVYVKSDDFKFNTPAKKAESFVDYVFIVTRLCWKAMYLPVFMSLFFSIYDFYKNGNVVASITVFIVLFSIILFCVLKVESNYYNIRLITIIKLIKFRFFVFFTN